MSFEIYKYKEYVHRSDLINKCMNTMDDSNIIKNILLEDPNRRFIIDDKDIGCNLYFYSKYSKVKIVRQDNYYFDFDYVPMISISNIYTRRDLNRISNIFISPDIIGLIEEKVTELNRQFKNSLLLDMDPNYQVATSLSTPISDLILKSLDLEGERGKFTMKYGRFKIKLSVSGNKVHVIEGSKLPIEDQLNLLSLSSIGYNVRNSGLTLSYGIKNINN